MEPYLGAKSHIALNGKAIVTDEMIQDSMASVMRNGVQPQHAIIVGRDSARSSRFSASSREACRKALPASGPGIDSSA